MKEKPVVLPVLETERLILRCFVPADAGALFDYAKDPEVGKNAGWKPHESIGESIAVIDMFVRDYAVWAVIVKATGRIIGSIGFHTSHRPGINYDLELGYAFGSGYWGKGYATEAAKCVIACAFDAFGAETLYVSHFTDNDRSRRVIEKCGFVYRGKLTASWKNYDGRSLDEEAYFLTRKRYKDFYG